MKKLLCSFLIIAFIAVMFITPVVLSAQAEITNVTIPAIVDSSGKIIIGIKDGGWTWVKYNWYFLLTTLVCIGFVIVRFTPNKKDDAFFDKYILGAFRLIGKILSFGMANDGSPPGKK